ncbi:Nudix hydrolase 15, mitochondrial [Gryganskiella cystojenkinii]|nr:Nudix hydrolase 15, mitochondrial [Gryganskiella cystojenkinii]
MTNTTTPKNVEVGLGVMIFHKGKLLVGKRIGSHSPGTWQIPGGFLDYGESFEECGARETFEETDIVLHEGSVQFFTANNNILAESGRHFVDIFMVATIGGDPVAKIMEPLKCERWEWITQDELQNDKGPYRPLFDPMTRLLEDHDLTKLFEASVAI